MRVQWGQLPVSMPGAGLLPHMSARHRTQIMDALFVGAGDFDRALAWINKSDENYGEFFKLWAKGAARAVSQEHTMNADSVEAMWERLEARERGQVIDVPSVVVHDAS